MRSRPTTAEAALWSRLRRRALGFRFRRQHVVAGYIVDFYCPSLRLAIEVDGAAHEHREQSDRARTSHLMHLGVAVLRFDNARVLGDAESVMAHIRSQCAARQVALASPIAVESPR